MAETSGIADADGLNHVAYSYQWLADGVNIAGATGATYIPADSDEGKAIRVKVSFADDKNNRETLTSAATAPVAPVTVEPESVEPESGPLAGFTVVDASDQTVVGTLAGGDALALEDPDNGSYGIRADVVAGEAIGSVRLELTGPRDVARTENLAPYSLYGEGGDGLHGQALPAGGYTLTATAYSQRDLGGDVLGTLVVSFTVAAEPPPPPLTAEFPSSAFSSKSHKGAEDRPQVVVEFSREAPSIDASSPSVSVTGGAVSNVQKHEEQGLEYAWVFFLDVAGDGPVEFSLLTGQPCDEGGICAGDSTPLSEVPAARIIPGPEQEEEPQNTPAAGAPTISGTPQVGETLTAETDGINDADGLDHVSFSYQRVRIDGGVDADITGATGGSYILADPDEGRFIKVKVSFTDDEGNSESLTSEPTVAVSAVAAEPAQPGPLTGFTLVDVSDQAVVATLTDGAALTLDDHGAGSYGIRADTEQDAGIGSVGLELTGPKSVSKTEGIAPFPCMGMTAPISTESRCRQGSTH